MVACRKTHQYLLILLGLVLILASIIVGVTYVAADNIPTADSSTKSSTSGNRSSKDGGNSNSNTTIISTLQTIKPSLKYKANSVAQISPDMSVKVISSDIFQGLIWTAENHPRKRKMTDLTRGPEQKSMQT